MFSAKPVINFCQRCEALMSPMALQTFSPVIGENDDGEPTYGPAEHLCAVCIRRAVDDEHKATRGR
jgi:hypothetical protein